MSDPATKPKRKAFKVRHGNAHITVAPWKHPQTGAQRWRFGYRDAAGSPWKYRTFERKDEAELAAHQQLLDHGKDVSILADQSPARLRWLAQIAAAVPEGDERAVMDFLTSMSRSTDLAMSVGRFVSSRESKAGERTPHLRTLAGLLEGFAAAFPNRKVASIQLPELQDWFDTRTEGTGWKRKKDIRAALIQFYFWARKEGIAGSDAVTVAERLPEIGGRQHGERRVLTPAEFMQCAEAISEEYRVWLVLGCFAGLRPEEIAPKEAKRAIKRGLLCEEIDWNFKIIRVAAETAKVKTPRIVPMSDALIAWLDWAGIKSDMTGPVCRHYPKPAEYAKLGKLVFGGEWPRNVCRHSYGSYRNALLRDLGRVAEEMGTSIPMLHGHYHNPQPQELGEEWFNLRPPVPICTNEKGGAVSSTRQHHARKTS